jgi:hypothetical protein
MIEKLLSRRASKHSALDCNGRQGSSVRERVYDAGDWPPRPRRVQPLPDKVCISPQPYRSWLLCLWIDLRLVLVPRSFRSAKLKIVICAASCRSRLWLCTMTTRKSALCLRMSGTRTPPVCDIQSFRRSAKQMGVLSFATLIPGAGKSAGVRLYQDELVALLLPMLTSASWSQKKVAAVTISDMATSIGKRLFSRLCCLASYWPLLSKPRFALRTPQRRRFDPLLSAVGLGKIIMRGMCASVHKFGPNGSWAGHRQGRRWTRAARRCFPR